MHDNNEKVNALLQSVPIPRMARVRQKFDSRRVADPQSTLRGLLDRPELKAAVRPGMKVAVTAGSRGIDNIVTILRETVDFIRQQGGEPFLIPAMGSHGGAVAEGQVTVLESFHITEETMGCPIRATMEVVQIGALEDGTPIYLDKYAHEADGVVVVNRIKPHTGFRGHYESGLFKMMCIGLGKQKGAETVHGRGRRRMGETIELGGSIYLEKAKILFGVGTIENAFDQTYKLLTFTPDEIRTKEPECLLEARSLMPRILVEDLDVLIIDYMGKNISGTGMDPNITRSFSYESGISRVGRPRKIAVLDLTEQSHGAAVGLGTADVTTHRLYEKVDFNTTYPNLLTSGGTDSAKIPMVFDSQRLAIQAAVKTALGADRDKFRMVHMRDTLHLGEIEVSEAILEEIRNDPAFELLEEPQDMVFNEAGNLF
ncbi:MAG: lactate racemase domain-containing protein [Pseudoflavonifractor sp.]|nr:lactate racemase domain-containing protein [Pseudoflavonifractor sp.]